MCVGFFLGGGSIFFHVIILFIYKQNGEEDLITEDVTGQTDGEREKVGFRN